jgi:hypothetical protein
MIGIRFCRRLPDRVIRLVPADLILLALLAAHSLRAAAVWEGPLLTFNQPAPDPAQATNQDRITPGVWLTRAASGGLFNAARETGFTNGSPANTEWAFGSLTNAAALHYTNWLGWLNGNSPTSMVGSNVVAHLLAEDTYLSFNFSYWASKGAGGFTYQRSTPVQPILFASPAAAPLSQSHFNFSYTAYPGLGYVVQSSTNLLDWSSAATNLAASTLVPVAAPPPAVGADFFRVRQLPGR